MLSWEEFQSNPDKKSNDEVSVVREKIQDVTCQEIEQKVAGYKLERAGVLMRWNHFRPTS